jgi:hypothetical protein
MSGGHPWTQRRDLGSAGVLSARRQGWMAMRYVGYVAVLLVVQLFVMASMGEPVIQMRLWSPAIQFAPAYVKLSITVPQHRDNRWVRVEALCGDVSLSASEIQIDGEYSERTFWPKPWELDEPCEYELLARLAGQNGRSGSTRTVLVVQGHSE